MGVASVYDDVARIQQGDKFLDEVVHSLPGFHHEEYLAGRCKRLHQILQRMGPVEVLACSAAVYEFVHLLNRAVENTNAEALAFHVEDEVFAHDCQADEADV